MKQVTPVPSVNGNSSTVGHAPRRDYVNVNYDGPRNPCRRSQV